jgi:hypothetical protein
MATSGGVKNAAMSAGRGLAKARNQGASYAKGGMIAMPQAASTAPKKAMRGKALPMKSPAMGPGMQMGMKKGGKC